MNNSIQYAQVMSNFDSVYNAPLNVIPQPARYIPMPSSATFSSFSNRSSAPLFRRTASPPPRQPLSTESGPKFNFDLYKMNENDDQYDTYPSPSYRPLSPLSSSITYHYPTYSPRSSSPSQSQPLLKLRQINDELCHALARSELIDPSRQFPPHYHIHHYPISEQPSYQNYRSRSIDEVYSPPSPPELEVSPKIRKARVTYKIHIPKQHRQEHHHHHHRKSSHHKSTSDVSSSDDTITVDLYPTRDQGFVKQGKKHSENQSPWVVEGTSLRRDSYSEISTSRTPKGPYYGDKPIKSHRRSVRSKERPSSSSRRLSPYVSSRNRRNSARLNTSESSPSKTREHVWHPPSKTVSSRPPKYFEPTLKPEYDIPTGKRTNIDEVESEPVSQRKSISNRTKIRSGDPKLKKRIANAESKVKSAWEPTITGLSQSTAKEPKPPSPHLVKQTTITTPPKSKIKSVPSEPRTPVKKVVTPPPQPPKTTNTDRSLFNDIPTKPIFESTPRNQSIVEENADDLFENESQTSERSKKQEVVPHLPPQIENIATPPPEQSRKPSAELPKPTTTHDVSMRGNNEKNIPDHNKPPPSASQVDKNNNEDDDDDEERSDVEQPILGPPKIPIPERKDDKNDESAADEDDEEVARSFNINRWLNDASKAIFSASKKGDTPPPPSQPPPTSHVKTPPHREEQPPSSESPDHNLYKPPFGPKKKDEKAATPPPSTGDTVDADDFFS